MHFLLTNDDGIRSEGLWALAAALRTGGEVTVVAPLREASASSQAITLGRALRVLPFAGPYAMQGHAVDGTPADCVKLALREIVPAATHVVAGINLGANVGGGVFYSGTIAAAREGRLAGRAAAAVSMETSGDIPPDFVSTAAHAARLLQRLLSPGGPRVVWNLNYPARPSGARVCLAPQDGGALREWYAREGADGAGIGYRLDGDWEAPSGEETDLAVVRGGRICITPLSLDWTDRGALEHARGLGIAAGGGAP